MTYHKIPSIYRREIAKPFNLIDGEYISDELEALENIDWVFTEKVDGTNIRIIWDGHRIAYGGRTDKANLPHFLIDKLDEMFGGDAVEQYFEQTFGEKHVVIYGEGYGAKIAKGGGNYKDTQDFVVFDVQVDGVYLAIDNVVDVAESLGVDTVPIVHVGTLQSAVDMVKGGLMSQWGDFEAEGLVGKPSVDLFNRKGERIVVKIKARDLNGGKKTQKTA